MTGPVLVFATFLLVVAGGVLYLDGQEGWAQFLWVLASGTAGAGCVAWIDSWREGRPGHGTRTCPYSWYTHGKAASHHIHACTVRSWAEPHVHLCGCGETEGTER